MESEKNHWRSRIEIIQVTTFAELREAVNEFCSDKFVVGIQYPDTFQVADSWVAVISYKVQESSD